ncbi:unnamed protein product [Rotaria sordida]|uniref:Calponin-homology (CH) domain-containing protein n=1 Tax=Rotaria sordida TaxID=392033 RepID=A0A819HQF5_9BILA|nr:unnamed protein product [Rotaria sordida]CAF1076717.1 unnamed protein product [Rotaria sordida]CAF1141236.1 unnamed protein product [Rotaria sordida]CAF1204849.1 unnamed protein product [Rotaria sordida]CAF1218249.1 unnamed protein product [Rotaria sordida]
MSWEMELDESLLEELYQWIDSLSLSRAKQRIERDFSDGLLVAEIIYYYLPELVDLQNYNSANSLEHKKSNWKMLNKKILSNIGLDIPDVIISGLSNCKPGLIEVLLFNLRLKIDEQLELKQKAIQQPIKSSIDRNKRKNISNLNYEEVKQEYLQQQEQIEILKAKIRRLEHVLQLKDTRIKELSTILQHH